MPADIPHGPQDGSFEASPDGRGPGPATRPRRPWARAFVAAAALAAIGVAGFSVRDQIPSIARSEKAPAPGVGAPPLPAFRSRLSVTRVGAGRPADPTTVVVALGRAESPTEEELIRGADPRRLLNEIVRQAVLVAAHDHLAAVTRDAVIGEEPPAGKAVAEAEVAWVLSPRERGSTLTITPVGDAGGGPHVLELPRADSATDPAAATYPRVLERTERLVREELPKVFQALRLDGAPIVVKADGALPSGVDKRLATLTFTEQFAALRAIHAAIRADGESPQRLGGLIRGYAHLGVLAESHWNPAHDVFKARALLAAQRWVARGPRSAEALRHRAYAYALSGLHRFALDDLAAASTLPGAGDPKSHWSRLIDAYCRFDTKALLQTAPGPDRELGLFLAFLTVEGTWSSMRIVEVGRALLREESS